MALCQERTAELSALVNQFILRRTNTLLSQHLPPKARPPAPQAALHALLRPPVWS